jgi:hypothetical protein
MKVEATYGTKDNPVWSHIPSVLSMNQYQDYPQNFLLRVVAHLDILKSSFFLASSNLEDEIPFKGGSL